MPKIHDKIEVLKRKARAKKIERDYKRKEEGLEAEMHRSLNNIFFGNLSDEKAFEETINLFLNELFRLYMLKQKYRLKAELKEEILFNYLDSFFKTITRKALNMLKETKKSKESKEMKKENKNKKEEWIGRKIKAQDKIVDEIYNTFKDLVPGLSKGELKREAKGIFSNPLYPYYFALKEYLSYYLLKRSEYAKKLAFDTFREFRRLIKGIVLQKEGYRVFKDVNIEGAELSHGNKKVFAVAPSDFPELMLTHELIHLVFGKIGKRLREDEFLTELVAIHILHNILSDEVKNYLIRKHKSEFDLNNPYRKALETAYETIILNKKPIDLEKIIKEHKFA